MILQIRDKAVKFGGVRHHNNCVMEASHMRQAVQRQLLTPLDKCAYISLFQGKKFFVDICFRHEGLFSEATFKDIAQLETVNNNSVVVQLTDDGSMSARDLREGKNLVKNVKKKFPVGSPHPCHVVGLDWVGGVAVCSLHKSLLSGVMRIDELVVDSAPQSRSSCRPALSWTSGRTCPTSFNVPLQHLERKFFPGDKVKCRVLKLNPDKKKLHLTSPSSGQRGV